MCKRWSWHGNSWSSTTTRSKKIAPHPEPLFARAGRYLLTPGTVDHRYVGSTEPSQWHFLQQWQDGCNQGGAFFSFVFHCNGSFAQFCLVLLFTFVFAGVMLIITAGAFAYTFEQLFLYYSGICPIKRTYYITDSATKQVERSGPQCHKGTGRNAAGKVCPLPVAYKIPSTGRTREAPRPGKSTAWG